MIELPDSVWTIRNNAFANNQLTQVTVNNSTTDFRTDVFANNQTNSNDLTIIGPGQSSAKEYAEKNNHSFYQFSRILSFNPLDDLKVSYGTPRNELTLPDEIKVDVLLSSGGRASEDLSIK